MQTRSTYNIPESWLLITASKWPLDQSQKTWSESTHSRTTATCCTTGRTAPGSSPQTICYLRSGVQEPPPNSQTHTWPYCTAFLLPAPASQAGREHLSTQVLPKHCCSSDIFLFSAAPPHNSDLEIIFPKLLQASYLGKPILGLHSWK